MLIQGVKVGDVAAAVVAAVPKQTKQLCCLSMATWNKHVDNAKLTVLNILRTSHNVWLERILVEKLRETAVGWRSGQKWPTQRMWCPFNSLHHVRVDIRLQLQLVGMLIWHWLCAFGADFGWQVARCFSSELGKLGSTVMKKDQNRGDNTILPILPRQSWKLIAVGACREDNLTMVMHVCCRHWLATGCGLQHRSGQIWLHMVKNDQNVWWDTLLALLSGQS